MSDADLVSFERAFEYWAMGTSRRYHLRDDDPAQHQCDMGWRVKGAPR